MSKSSAKASKAGTARKAQRLLSAEAGDRIRIITARKASPVQRKVYENGP